MRLAQTAKLGGEPVAISRLGFGCAGLMRVTGRRRRQRLLAAALDAGVTHFDLARMYGLGAAEGELGRLARDRRDEMTIATKFGIDARPSSWMARLQGPARLAIGRFPALRRLAKRHEGAVHAPRGYDAAAARASLETSLSELGVEYVDILFVHDPIRAGEAPREELVEFLEGARREGSIRAWGISGEPGPVAELAARMPPGGVIQVREDAFERAGPEPAGPRIAFGFLATALPRILERLGADEAARRRWSEALGIDAADPSALVGVLLADGLDANPGGAVLFGTTRAERIAAMTAAVDEVDPGQVEALRRLVAAELDADRPR